jgi:glucose-6-phosphate-specific signal transduction histidine kinase
VDEVRAENEQVKQENEQVKQLANQLYQEKLQTLQRMRKAGLSEADICAFLNISPEELEQLTKDSSDE